MEQDAARAVIQTARAGTPGRARALACAAVRVYREGPGAARNIHYWAVGERSWSHCPALAWTPAMVRCAPWSIRSTKVTTRGPIQAAPAFDTGSRMSRQIHSAQP